MRTGTAGSMPGCAMECGFGLNDERADEILSRGQVVNQPDRFAGPDRKRRKLAVRDALAIGLFRTGISPQFGFASTPFVQVGVAESASGVLGRPR